MHTNIVSDRPRTISRSMPIAESHNDSRLFNTESLHMDCLRVASFIIYCSLFIGQIVVLLVSYFAKVKSVELALVELDEARGYDSTRVV